MSNYLSEEVVKATNAAKQEELEKYYKQLRSDLAELMEVIHTVKLNHCQFRSEENSNRSTENQVDINEEELFRLERLCEQVTAYLSTLRFEKILGGVITTNEMHNSSITVLGRQAEMLSKVHESVKSVAPSKKISELLQEVRTTAYAPSRSKIWLRRIMAVGTSLACAALAITAVAVLMTPGVNIAAAIVAVPLTLKAGAAFFGLCGPAIMHLKFGPMSVPAPDPSTVGSTAAPGLGGAWLAKKHTFWLNKPRELTARKTQVATVRYLAEKLSAKIDNATERNGVAAFIKDEIKKASMAYQAGESAWLYERKQSKMEKAHNRLSAIAEVMERNGFAKLSLESVKEMLTPAPVSSSFGRLFQAGVSQHVGVTHLPRAFANTH